MENNKMLNYIKDVLENMPSGWLNLTTHRLDIYDERLSKTQFLEQGRKCNQFFVEDDTYFGYSKKKLISK